MNNDLDNSKNDVAPKPFRHLVGVLLEMCELQLRLLRADALCAAKATRVAAVLVVLALVLLMAALPILLLAASEWMVHSWEITRAASLALAGGGALLLSAALLLGAKNAIGQGIATLSRSTDELIQNVESLKQGFADGQPEARQGSDASPPNPSRR